MRYAITGNFDPDEWNLFQHRCGHDLWCAVPMSHRLPTFLFSGAWDYAERKDLQRIVAIGFRPNVASNGVVLNGFFLFHKLHA